MIAYLCIFLINAFAFTRFTIIDWIPSLNLGHDKVRTNGEKAEQHYSRNLTRSLIKSQEETTKQQKQSTVT